MQFNSGGIGKDSLTYQNVKNLSLKENSIRNPKKTGKENSESAAISVARVGASVEEKTAARSCPYARKTKTRIENLPPKRNSIRNLDLNRIGKENSESAAISVARIDANAEKKTTARNHLCRKRAGTQVEEDLVFPKKVKTLLFRVEGSNSIIGNQNELKVRQVEAELDKASNLLEEKQSSFDSQAVQPEESKTKIEEAQKEISDERDQLERELEGSSNAAIELNNKVKETLDERDQLERELEGSSNAAIELNNKVKELEEKNDQVNELNEKVFSIETERNTLKDQITKIQNELARKESEIGRLNDQLSKSYQHIEQLKQDKNVEEQLARKESEIGRLNDQLSKSYQHIEQLKQDKNVEEQLARKESEIGRLNDQLSKSYQHIEQLKQDKNKKEEELLDQQNKVKELNDKVNSITNERNCLNGQIETQLLEKNIEAYVEEQLARKESEIGRLNDQLSKSYQHIEQLKQDKNKKEEELLDQQNKVKELNDKVNSITNERNCLNGQIETQLLEKNIEAYVEEQLARKESEIGRLNDQLSKSYQHIEQLKQDKNKKEEELLDQQNKVKELNDKVNSITNERNCLNGQIETQLLEKNIEAYVEEQLARKESEIGRLNDQLSKSYQHIEQLKQDKNVEEQLARKESEIGRLNDQLSKSYQHIEQLKQDKNKKEEELLDQQNKVKELNDKVNSITNERNCLNGQIETQLLEKNIEAYVEEQLARKESEIGRLNDQLSKSYQHIEQLKQDKNKKEEELLDQQNKVKELNDKVNSITNERNCLNGQIETQLLEKNIEAYVEEQLARKESEIGRLNDQLSKSYQHIEQLKQDKNKKEEELLDQQNKVKELNDKVNSITNERNCLNGQIETQLLEKNIEAYVEEQLARKESEIGRLNDQLSKSYQHIEQLKQDKNVEEQLARKESEIGRLNDQLSKSYQHIEQLKQDKNKKEEELLDQQNKVKELNDKVNSITNERNCLNGQIETQLLEKNKEFDEFKKERDTLTNQVQEKKNELSAKEEAFSKVQTNAQDLTYEVNQKDQQLEQVVREKQRLEAKFRGLNEKYSEVKNKDRGYIENLTCKLRQAKSEFIDNENKLSDQIEKLKEEKEILLEQLRAKSTGSASFRKQQSKIDSLKQQIKQKEEPKSVRNLEQLQNISGQNKIETTVPENSAESELNSTRLTEFEGNNIHVQASAAPAATVTSMNVKNIEKVPVMLETPSDKSGSQKLVSVQQEMSSVANESSGQVNGSQTNGMQPNNSSNGSIIVTQSVQKNKWPTTATWKLAIAGVLAGIAASVAYFTFSASLLVTGVIAGVGACCLVAAAIVYYCNKPSSSLEKSSIDKVAVNGYTAAASCE